ncbi:MAG: molecular chaperone DnaJ [Candidatus Nealsonbacteria bacterium]
MPKDYYQILGVDKAASDEDIKKAYRRLAHKHHPDKGGDEKKFKEINEAYQTLSDKAKRTQYDQFGNAFEGTPGNGFGGFDFESMRDRFGGNFNQSDFSEIFEEIFGFGQTRRKSDMRRGNDIEVEVEMPLEETLKSQEKEIRLYKNIVCSRCHGKGAEPGTKVNECFSCRGTGQVQQIRKTVFGSITRTAVCPECSGEGQKPENPCNVCRGEGRMKAEEKIKVYIPAGVDTNQVIKIEGKGEAGKKGGENGDLYIRVFVKKHSLFKRKGDDLILQKDISFSQAALGDEIEIPILEGANIMLKVSSGTESGKVLRLSGRGIPHFSNYGRGNLYIELVVKIPKKLSRKQKELLERLKEEGV